MIQIEITRYTIKKLEEVMEKYNKGRESFSIHEYQDMINKLCEFYLALGKKSKLDVLGK